MTPPAGRVRIIGGTLRGRHLVVPNLPGLRPTPDRVRETLFNWLQPAITGACCLDLFAGSGALGFEAASRGAARVVSLDNSATAIRQLRQQCRHFGLAAVEVIQGNALAWLGGSPEPFDLVFLDPPFETGLLVPALEKLTRGWLALGAWVSVEEAAAQPPLLLPAGLRWRRQQTTGRVRFGLLEWEVL
ncbi:Ribosomal RNA small subunit methyltransferase D [Gammaproteobacteria bacterium]